MPFQYFFCRLPSCTISSNPLIYGLLALFQKFCQANSSLNTRYVPNIMSDTAVTSLKKICLLPAIKDPKSLIRKHCNTTEVRKHNRGER